MDVDLVASGILDEDHVQVDDHNNEVSNFEGERCGICMDIIIDRGVLDSCQHWFCFACIDNWSTITNLCPLCQSEFQLITCVPVYDTIGSNKTDEDSFSRDDDWCIEGKSNSLSFPSYYIDENAVICLDGDGCKIRSGSTTLEEDSNLDTSIACDSCDKWYHAFCVGFDPEGTSEDTWLCPRCVANAATQKPDAIQKTNSHCGLGNVESISLTEAGFSGKVSVSVADVGETAVVVSMVGANQCAEERGESFLSLPEVQKDLTTEPSNSDGSCSNLEAPPSEKGNTQLVLGAQELELSLSHNTFSTLLSNPSVPSHIKTSKAAEDVNDLSSLGGVGTSQKLSVESHALKQVSENESTMGLHLGLSIGCFLSVDDMNDVGTISQINTNFKDQNRVGEFLSQDEKIIHDDNDNAGRIIGAKRKLADCRDDVFMSSDGEGPQGKNETEASPKRIRAEALVQTDVKSEPNASGLHDIVKCPNLKAVSIDSKVRNHLGKEDDVPDIMTIVHGIGCKTSKGLAGDYDPDESLKEGEAVAGLRVKKIVRRASEDKESSIVVQKLRKEIREAVRNRSSNDIGEHLFDPKLLTAFRAVIAGPKPEPPKRLSPLAVKAKKSMLQKGKVRENLTKKIYGDSNGRRRRAWDRDCEVEFWKYRCMRASKPEKIETLKSVLTLLKKNPESSDGEPMSECRASNPILSRLYLADTSVFPRKDDIKPLSAIKSTGSTEQNKEQSGSVEKSSTSTIDSHTMKGAETNKADLKGIETYVSNLKVTAASSKVPLNRSLEGSLATAAIGSKVISRKEAVVKSDDVKTDKRKWALQVLARKKAAETKTGANEEQEDSTMLKGNYPLLAQLPVDMRPALASSRHNKIPMSVRKTQLYRLTEHFLRKANLPVIRRTAETELAVADATNIEKGIADRSNSKVVYLNLCSQEILRHSDESKSIRARDSSSPSPSEAPTDRQVQGTGECSIDPVALEALRTAGLLSDSPPNSPYYKTEVASEADDSSIKIREEEPDNVFEMDSHLEADIYGDFEYDIEDEDYIGVSAEKVPKLQPEECVSKMKVVFSTLNSESLNNVVNLEDHERLGNVEVLNGSSSSPMSHTDSMIKYSTVKDGSDKSSVPLEPLADNEGEEFSVAECEELYGPDKEPLINKFPGVSQKLYGMVDAENPAEKRDTEDNGSHVLSKTVNAPDPGTHSMAGIVIVGTVGHNSSGGENSANSPTDENVQKKEKLNMDADKQSDGVNFVSKKVEAYIKEHIRPLCKSGVITTDQYRWAVAKTTDKVMKYHLNAKNANFLIKEGEKVKKLAEQYVEAAQQKGRNDPS